MTDQSLMVDNNNEMAKKLSEPSADSSCKKDKKADLFVKNRTDEQLDNSKDRMTTLSQATMNSHLLNQRPKYIFQSEHARLKCVSHIQQEVKAQEEYEEALSENSESLAELKSESGQISDYPIELNEVQQQCHWSFKENVNEAMQAEYEHVDHQNDVNIVSALYDQIKIDENPKKENEIEYLEHCAQLLIKSMVIREKYMVLSQQPFPFTTAKYLNKVFLDDQVVDTHNPTCTNGLKEQRIHQVINDKNEPNVSAAHKDDPFDIDIVPSLNCKFKLIDGVVHIYNSDNTPFSNFVYSDLKMFVEDYYLMLHLISNEPLQNSKCIVR